MAIRHLPLQSSSLVLFVLLVPVVTANRLADAFSGFARTSLRAGVPADGSTGGADGASAGSGDGGVRLRVPEGYSAVLETGTTNGRLTHDLPAAGRPSARRLTTTLGRGGPHLRVVTTNGGVTVARN
jgi:hypothetical protein